MAGRETVHFGLEHLGRLEANWDSYGSPPPSTLAIQTASRLIKAAAQHGAPYTIAPVAGGAIQLEWRGRGVEVELGISSGGVIGYLLIDRRGDEPVYKEREAVSPEEALSAIRRTLAE